MALKKAGIAAAPAAKSKKDEMPVLRVAGDVVKRFNEANAALKKAETDKAELEKQLKPAALAEIYRLNGVTPLKPESSVRLMDTTGATARVSHQNKYSLADGEQADAIFTQLGTDINLYAQETAKAAFDSKVFLDAQGNFDPARYEAFKTAIDAVAATLRCPSPLTSKTVVLPKPNFDAERWTAFTPAQQPMVAMALPNTVTLTAGTNGVEEV